MFDEGFMKERTCLQNLENEDPRHGFSIEPQGSWGRFERASPAWSSLEQPGAHRGTWERLGAAQSSLKLLGAA